MWNNSPVPLRRMVRRLSICCWLTPPKVSSIKSSTFPNMMLMGVRISCEMTLKSLCLMLSDSSSRRVNLVRSSTLLSSAVNKRWFSMATPSTRPKAANSWTSCSPNPPRCGLATASVPTMPSRAIRGTPRIELMPFFFNARYAQERSVCTLSNRIGLRVRKILPELLSPILTLGNFSA